MYTYYVCMESYSLLAVSTLVSSVHVSDHVHTYSVIGSIWDSKARSELRGFAYLFFSLIRPRFPHGLPKGGQICEGLLYNQLEEGYRYCTMNYRDYL
jgi:hypothetical protein